MKTRMTLIVPLLFAAITVGCSDAPTPLPPPVVNAKPVEKPLNTSGKPDKSPSAGAKGQLQLVD